MLLHLIFRSRVSTSLRAKRVNEKQKTNLNLLSHSLIRRSLEQYDRTVDVDDRKSRNGPQDLSQRQRLSSHNITIRIVLACEANASALLSKWTRRKGERQRERQRTSHSSHTFILGSRLEMITLPPLKVLCEIHCPLSFSSSIVQSLHAALGDHCKGWHKVISLKKSSCV